MPCYHFTYHGYGTWMPDEDDGYVRRGAGQLPQDVLVAAEYRQRMKTEVSLFDEPHQRALIDEAHGAAGKQDFRVHYIATEPTHIHVLVSWKDDRPWMKLRTAIKSSLSRRLNRDFGKRPWLSEGASRRRVINQEHYDYLVCTYLPRHSGWKWSEEQGLHK
jgi:REP element-mobilizing transposase RayT